MFSKETKFVILAGYTSVPKSLLNSVVHICDGGNGHMQSELCLTYAYVKKEVPLNMFLKENCGW